MVAGREDAGVRRREEWGFRYLRDSRCGRRGVATDDGEGTGRRPGIHTRRQIHLLQLRTHRAHADLADAGRWKRTRAGDVWRKQRLVSALLARRAADGVPYV